MHKIFNSLFAKHGKKLFMLAVILFTPFCLFAAGSEVPSVGPVRVEFIIFGLILLGVALFHKQTFWVAITGLAILLTFKLIFDPGFHLGEHFFGTTPMGEQIMNKELRQGEWGIILNLLGLLLGFALLSKVFEESGVPGVLPKFLPNDWKGPALLLIFYLRSFIIP